MPKAPNDQFYVQRGCESEHRIKELKLGLAADRLSCRSFTANQFRLVLVQAAYVLLLKIRQAAAGTSLAVAQVERLRSLLIKTAARVRVSARRILVDAISIDRPSVTWGAIFCLRGDRFYSPWRSNQRVNSSG